MISVYIQNSSHKSGPLVPKKYPSLRLETRSWRLKTGCLVLTKWHMMIYTLTYPQNLISVSYGPESMIYPLKNLFQGAGKRFLRAENRLTGHNLVSFNDVYCLKIFWKFCKIWKNGKANPLVFFSMKKKIILKILKIFMRLLWWILSIF